MASKFLFKKKNQKKLYRLVENLQFTEVNNEIVLLGSVVGLNNQ